MKSAVYLVPVAHGLGALQSMANHACKVVTDDGGEVVSVSHATHTEGARNARMWTVLVVFKPRSLS